MSDFDRIGNFVSVFKLNYLIGRIYSLFRKVEVFSNSEAISLAIKETLRYALFLGTFAGTFCSLDEIISALGGHRRHAPILLFFIFFFFNLNVESI